MANPTNFVKITGPTGERTFYTTPRVQAFSNDNTDDLTDAVNTFIQELATPLTDSLKYNVIRVDLSSAQLSNNIIQYSALIHYLVWTAA